MKQQLFLNIDENLLEKVNKTAFNQGYSMSRTVEKMLMDYYLIHELLDEEIFFNLSNKVNFLNAELNEMNRERLTPALCESDLSRVLSIKIINEQTDRFLILQGKPKGINTSKEFNLSMVISSSDFNKMKNELKEEMVVYVTGEAINYKRKNAIINYCRKCTGDIKTVALCQNEKCPLRPFRNGREEVLTGQEGEIKVLDKRPVRGRQRRDKGEY